MTFNSQLYDELLAMKEYQRVLQELVDNGKLEAVEYRPRIKAGFDV